MADVDATTYNKCNVVKGNKMHIDSSVAHAQNQHMTQCCSVAHEQNQHTAQCCSVAHTQNQRTTQTSCSDRHAVRLASGYHVRWWFLDVYTLS